MRIPGKLLVWLLLTLGAPLSGQGDEIASNECGSAAKHGILTNMPARRLREVFGSKFNFAGARSTSVPLANFTVARLDADPVASLIAAIGDPELRRNLIDGEYAEPNYEVHMQGARATNDRYADKQWALQKIGIPQAWKLSRGSHKVTVAILDSGIDYMHPDLVDNLWHPPQGFAVNLKEGARTVSCDVTTLGFRAVDSDAACARPGDIDDDNGHGTHIAGIIGARGGNSIGSAGVNWYVTLLPVKVLDAHGAGTIESVIKGMDFVLQVNANPALRTKIQVLNASWGYSCDGGQKGEGRSALLDKYLQWLEQAGVLVVAAADNEFYDLDAAGAHPYYLTDFEHRGLIAVTGMDMAGRLYGSHGIHSVDIAAPGEEISSTYMGATRGKTSEGTAGTEMLWAPEHPGSGTSMATAFVSGAAALVLSHCPQLNPRQLKSVLLSSAAKTPKHRGLTATGSVPDVARAMQRCRMLSRRPGPRA